MDLAGSRTEKNLQLAFAGESQASLKYRYYAFRARKEGYEEIAAIFNETSDNEFEHAKIWFKLLNGNETKTLGNLKDAAFGEHYEWSKMYVDFAKIAKEEGFDNIAKLFENVGQIEKTHEEIYNELTKKVGEQTVFVANGECAWLCRNCGHIHFGNEAPKQCPVCSHPQAFFQRRK